jgi:hypothetical protein
MPAHMRPNKTVKPGRNYKNGRAAEYAARDVLIREGYHPDAIVRAAGSKGAADLVAVRDTGTTLLPDVLWVQVKRGTGRVTPEERKRLAALPGRVQSWTRIRGGFEREVIKR